MPKWTKSHPKIAVWVIRGPTFEVFGRVLRNAFFLFLRWAKIDPKWRKFGTWAAKTKKAHPFWAGRRVGRRSWECFFARFYKFWDNCLQNYLARLAPPSKDGVGGFKGLRPTRRPTNIKQIKMYLAKNMSFLKVSSQTVSIAVFSAFVTYFNMEQTYFSTFLETCGFLMLKALNTL